MEVKKTLQASAASWSGTLQVGLRRAAGASSERTYRVTRMKRRGLSSPPVPNRYTLLEEALMIGATEDQLIRHDTRQAAEVSFLLVAEAAELHPIGVPEEPRLFDPHHTGDERQSGFVGV